MPRSPRHTCRCPPVSRRLAPTNWEGFPINVGPEAEHGVRRGIHTFAADGLPTADRLPELQSADLPAPARLRHYPVGTKVEYTLYSPARDDWISEIGTVRFTKQTYEGIWDHRIEGDRSTIWLEGGEIQPQASSRSTRSCGCRT